MMGSSVGSTAAVGTSVGAVVGGTDVGVGVVFVVQATNHTASTRLRNRNKSRFIVSPPIVSHYCEIKMQYRPIFCFDKVR